MPDVVKLTIGGTTYSGWESVSIESALDTMADAFSMSGPFDPSRAEMVSAFKPFGYQNVKLEIDDQLLLTGRIESVSPSTSESDRAINVQGRSLTGSLIDCQIDGQGYSFAGMSLKSIATKLAKPFGINVSSTAGIGPVKAKASAPTTTADAAKPLDESRADPGQAVGDYLQSIAKPSGLLLTATETGDLLIMRPSASGAPVAALIEGIGHVKSVSASYNGTGRWSNYRVLQQQDGKTNITGKATDQAIKIYRPKVVTGSDGDAKSATKSAEMQRALSFAESIQVSVQVTGWRPGNGKPVWTPGQVVTLKAPGAFIMRETVFIIRRRTLTLDASEGRTSTLDLVLPSTYSGTMPGSYPWE